MIAALEDNEIIISIKRVCQMTSLSRTAISKMRASGIFPAEVQLGGRRIGFVKSEVIDWIASRIDARRGAA